jgi:hypothetical protein
MVAEERLTVEQAGEANKKKAKSKAPPSQTESGAPLNRLGGLCVGHPSTQRRPELYVQATRPLEEHLAGLFSGHGNLLIACIKITTYNDHRSAPFFRALVVSATKFTRS